MHDVIRIEDHWYVLATAAGTDDHVRVLKSNDAFVIFNRYGDIQKPGLGEQGLYYDGARFLSEFRMTINGRRPMFLNSTVVEDNSLMTADLTTPDLYDNGALIIPKSALHILRANLLSERTLHEQLRITNYGQQRHDFEVAFTIDNDFADVFEVRGVQRELHGECEPARIDGSRLTLVYRGLDAIVRRSEIVFSREPQAASERRFRFRLSLSPGETTEVSAVIRCCVGDDALTEPIEDHRTALRRIRSRQERHLAQCAEVVTSNERFNQWLNRSNADMGMLISETPQGRYPYAGVPWFNTVFGRDGIIAALEMLWLNPCIARDVLRVLAKHQADEDDPVTEAEPGRILHELRSGEMANLDLIPFGCYYGTVDATPLFVLLAAEYYLRTGDRECIERLWPNILRALEWIDHWGDKDGDGFIEYERRNPRGILQQGWKDSDDSVFHADGRPAEPPVAVCEAQGYVFAAKRGAALLAERLGERPLAARLRQQARALRARFNEKFWCEEIGTYAIALDGNKEQCRVRSSNAGHTLTTGIASDRYAERVTQQLNSAASFSGWGIRTLSCEQTGYNPMSYHNGSVWPHDNALIALGFARYGYKQAVLRLLSGMYDASTFIDMHRLPELFCGFDRLEGQGPARYPVACSPQAWSSGVAFSLLQASLGISFDADRALLEFRLPKLPRNLRRVEINRLQVGQGEVDLLLRRNPDNVGVSVKRREGNVEVSIVT
jgi:glycogen debranching enzyme